MCALAIVIPAYKAAFLGKTLQSLVKQTNKNFAVYIGNDAGDTGIQEIVNQFADHLNIHYKYFPDNLGQTSLVKQWERCFALTKNEEWLWLLPDDDFIDPNCIELFYTGLTQNHFDLFRFNVHFVTADAKIFKTNQPLKLLQNSYQNLIEKLSFSRPGTVAEFIFRREAFNKIGFAELPMAWGTDDLLWFLIGRQNGIVGCNDAHVYLRQSHLNISNDYIKLGKEKVKANFAFFNKLTETNAFAEEMADDQSKAQFRKVALEHILYNLQDFSLTLSLAEIKYYAVMGDRIWGGGVVRNMRRLYLNNRRVAKKVKQKVGE